jgi:hypothetical protein
MASSLRQYNTPEPEIRAMMGRLRKGEDVDRRQ